MEDQAASKKAAKKAIQRKPSCFANGVAKTTNSGQINLNFAWKEYSGDNGALNEYNTLNWLCDVRLLENDLERVSYTIRFSTDILIML